MAIIYTSGVVAGSSENGGDVGQRGLAQAGGRGGIPACILSPDSPAGAALPLLT